MYKMCVCVPCVCACVYIITHAHTHTHMCISSVLETTIYSCLITYPPPVITVNLHSIFYIPSTILDPKRKKKISVEKLKKYFAFVNFTFKYVSFRAWESIQQLHEICCFLNGNKYYTENKANSAIRIVDWEDLQL